MGKRGAFGVKTVRKNKFKKTLAFCGTAIYINNNVAPPRLLTMRNIGGDIFYRG
jgi:hypothetical protein